MKIFLFDLEAERDDEKFGGVKAIIARAVQLDSEAKVNAVYLQPHKRISYPQTLTQQLFLVVEGEGWVKEKPDEELAVKQGQAIFWEIGEVHESGTAIGMTAVIIEGINIDPAKLMPLLQEGTETDFSKGTG